MGDTTELLSREDSIPSLERTPSLVESSAAVLQICHVGASRFKTALHLHAKQAGLQWATKPNALGTPGILQHNIASFRRLQSYTSLLGNFQATPVYSRAVATKPFTDGKSGSPPGGQARKNYRNWRRFFKGCKQGVPS